jgi:hypothetical protein
MTTVCDDIKAARSELQRLGTNRQWRRAPKQVLEAGQGSQSCPGHGARETDLSTTPPKVRQKPPSSRRAPPRRKSPRAHRISLTFFISRIPCSLAMTRADSEMLTPDAWPRSTSVWRTQGRRLEAIPEQLASNPLQGASSALVVTPPSRRRPRRAASTHSTTGWGCRCSRPGIPPSTRTNRAVGGRVESRPHRAPSSSGPDRPCRR